MKCNLCPNKCNVDRDISVGFCGEKNAIRIAKYYMHKFEEPVISGANGSGTVFFTGCSLKCVFCQNYELSRSQRGKIVSPSELADIFKELEENGAHNINLVTPTHFINEIIKGLDIYKPNIPIVYNTHSYENPKDLKRIDDYVDIYLPDIKFYSSALSKRYTGKEDYFLIASKNIEFMANKPLIFAPNGLMKSGTIVRHLVMPLGVSDSKKILDWYVNIKNKTYFSLMSQYTPFGKIENFPELNRKITKREYDTVVDYAISLGISNMFYQDGKSADTSYIPKWDF